MSRKLPSQENNNNRFSISRHASGFLSDKEKKWDSLTGMQRVRYLYDYYKLPFVIILIVLYVIAFLIYRQVTQKSPILYTGMVNIAPNELTVRQLSGDYLTYADADTGKEEVKLYTGWYLTTNKDSEYFQYTYASQMKILASIDDEQLDIVLLDRESFDAFSQNGYLYNLEELLKGTELAERLKSCFVTNIEFLEDNAKEINFDSTIEFESVNIEYPMGLNFSGSFVAADTDYSDTIYLGVIANTPRKEEVIRYLTYLYSGP